MSIPFIPFPPIERIAVTGDRRTAAMIAADGTVCWWCLPNYDGPPLFGCLLDTGKGGHWRLGPRGLNFGRQHYLGDSPVLVTRWQDSGAVLELTDAMPWPDRSRPAGGEGRRVLLRRLRCLGGTARVVMHLEPRLDFKEAPRIRGAGPGFELCCGDLRLGLWLSRPMVADGGGFSEEFDLAAGEVFWAVLGLDEDPALWSAERVEGALAETLGYWRKWMASLTYSGSRQDLIRRSAMLVHLLAYAPSGALVAAPTTSLPEHIGNKRNYDYRFAWVRDASLSVAVLSLLGPTEEAQHYLDFLCGLEPGPTMPLQVMYRIDGSRDLDQVDVEGAIGYRHSPPVRFGNAAARMTERGSFGFLADCMLLYLERGGSWRDEYWHLLRRCTDYVAKEWNQPDAGTWEIPPNRHFVSTKVMCWVALDRALKIGEKLGREENVDHWRRAMTEIRSEVLGRGWSPQKQSFRQSYDCEAVDAALLLLPLTDFLPVDDSRVRATVARIEAELTVNGFVHRFDANEVPGQPDPPRGSLSETEGAFLMCTFWLARYYALCGVPERAAALLCKAERVAGETGLFSEAVDARSARLLGNMPLLFSQAEYARAALALARSETETEARRDPFAVQNSTEQADG
jgi:GH15 family glucan-1,4-alpha-glucosidase